ncbi:hypothetical protein SAMN05446037_102640 [Anaerovirgula multivorans]|uniref:Uncharacterized protein n=1 Tax=Anaerovirgula multivorans TaxID=312168 RepID=A0A239I9P4_9FIRM|nr:hypothetical protein SAMN05446037_102640 [Anaerovirgula multivorans]
MVFDTLMMKDFKLNKIIYERTIRNKQELKKTYEYIEINSLKGEKRR